MTHRPDLERIIKECEWAIARIEDYGSTTMMSRSFFADVEKLLKNQPELVLCKHCRMGEMETNFYGEPCIVCHNPANGVAHVWHKPDWFCADGRRVDNDA